MLGAEGPSFRSIYEWFSSVSLYKANPVMTVLLGREQWTLGQFQMLLGLYHFLSHNIDDILGNFYHHFDSHGWDRCDHSKSPIFFLQISSAKIPWELMLLRFLLWECQLSLQTLGTVLFQF